jgi:hypothetical protein
MQEFCDKMDVDKKMNLSFNNDCEKKGHNPKKLEFVNYYCVSKD